MLETVDVRRTQGPMCFVDKFTVYVTPTGQLVVSSGNQRVTCTEQDVKQLFEYFLQYARLFNQG